MTKRREKIKNKRKHENFFCRSLRGKQATLVLEDSTWSANNLCVSFSAQTQIACADKIVQASRLVRLRSGKRGEKEKKKNNPNYSFGGKKCQHGIKIRKKIIVS
jgi:hypothetical protein